MSERADCRFCLHTLNVHGPSGCWENITHDDGDTYVCPCTYATLTFGCQHSKRRAGSTQKGTRNE